MRLCLIMKMKQQEIVGHGAAKQVSENKNCKNIVIYFRSGLSLD